jgi:hypothetical protein
MATWQIMKLAELTAISRSSALPATVYEPPKFLKSRSFSADMAGYCNGIEVSQCATRIAMHSLIATTVTEYGQLLGKHAL